jgi:hypothetical protein
VSGVPVRPGSAELQLGSLRPRMPSFPPHAELELGFLGESDLQGSQRCFDIRSIPPRLLTRIGDEHSRGVVSTKSCHVTAGMR